MVICALQFCMSNSLIEPSQLLSIMICPSCSLCFADSFRHNSYNVTFTEFLLSTQFLFVFMSRPTNCFLVADTRRRNAAYFPAYSILTVDCFIGVF